MYHGIFQRPWTRTNLEPKVRRLRDYKEEEEWLDQREEDEEEGLKQKERKVEERELFTIQERVGSLRSHLETKEMTEEDWEDEKRCNDLKKAWLKDFPEVFKEDLGEVSQVTAPLFILLPHSSPSFPNVT